MNEVALDLCKELFVVYRYSSRHFSVTFVFCCGLATKLLLAYFCEDMTLLGFDDIYLNKAFTTEHPNLLAVRLHVI